MIRIRKLILILNLYYTFLHYFWEILSSQGEKETKLNNFRQNYSVTCVKMLKNMRNSWMRKRNSRWRSVCVLGKHQFSKEEEEERGGEEEGGRTRAFGHAELKLFKLSYHEEEETRSQSGQER